MSDADKGDRERSEGGDGDRDDKPGAEAPSGGDGAGAESRAVAGEAADDAHMTDEDKARVAIKAMLGDDLDIEFVDGVCASARRIGRPSR